MTTSRSLAAPLLAEFVGTALLLAAVVGSGIMAERLSGGNVGVALLANAIATGGALYALIIMLGPVSGAHFNPAVTVALAVAGLAERRCVLPYALVQIVGGIVGVWLAHLMFDLPILQASTKLRSGIGQWAGEITATFGLALLILIGARRGSAALPAAVACYIVGAYWFTSSTSFANPAVTIARALSDTFAGIAPAHAPGFIIAQLVGTGVALLVARRLRDA
ncbi:MAG: aquaporin family protein [Alphaproteobacteria bacterium]|nr:aquaporin family protein [Alphaproteobacteria bacterium]